MRIIKSIFDRIGDWYYFGGNEENQKEVTLSDRVDCLYRELTFRIFGMCYGNSPGDFLRAVKDPTWRHYGD